MKRSLSLREDRDRQATRRHATRLPFGPGIVALVTYLHGCQMVSYARLPEMLDGMFGLKISEGVLRFQKAPSPNMLARAAKPFAECAQTIHETPRRGICWAATIKVRTTDNQDERRRAMAVVVVGVPFDLSGTHRQQWLRLINSLDWLFSATQMTSAFSGGSRLLDEL